MEEIMNYKFTIEMLKLVGAKDHIVSSTTKKEKYYEVEAVLDHKQTNIEYNYLVKWKNYPTSDNSWVKSTNFNIFKPINIYWRNLRATNKVSKVTPKKVQRATQVCTTPLRIVN
jgi:hypothetical protein